MFKFIMRKLSNPVITIIMLLFCFSTGQAQSKDLLDTEIASDFYAENLFQMCSFVSFLGSVPMGFESSVDLDLEKKTNKILIKKGKLNVVMDSIVKHNPNYRWEIRDGVVNVYPIDSRDEVLKNLLESKIKNFSTAEVGRAGIRKIIHETKEIKEILNSQQIELNIFIRTSLNETDEVIADFKFFNTDLRSVLNNIVKSSKENKLWFINRGNSKKEVLLVY